MDHGMDHGIGLLWIPFGFFAMLGMVAALFLTI
jgi:hypothetical protein